MIVQEIIDNHASHLLSFLREQVDDAIEHALVTGLLQNKELIRVGLNIAVVKAVEDTIRGNQADSAIGSVTLQVVESEFFVRDISQGIVEEDTVFK